MAKDTSKVTIELDDQTARRLSDLAHHAAKPREEVVLEALRDYLKHADPSLGTDKPVPPPKGG